MREIYPPQIIASAILQAAQKPVRELIFGGSGKIKASALRHSSKRVP
jgi:hypothetical protein